MDSEEDMGCLWGVYHSLPEVMSLLTRKEYLCLAEVKELMKIYHEMRCEVKEPPERHKNVFIVLEGLDGSGKTTASRKLSEHLGGVAMSTPSGKFLPLRSFFDTQHVTLRRAYYSLSNYAAGLEIAAALERQPVILDRFWHSTAAYALAGEAKDLSDLPKETDPVYKWPSDLYPHPDIVFYLTVSEDVRFKRISHRDSVHTIEEMRLAKETNYRKMLYEVYRRMREPSIIEIDGDRSVDSIVDTIDKQIAAITSSGK